MLLVDLPAHGESSGNRITFGARESAGARSTLEYLRRVGPGGRVGALRVPVLVVAGEADRHTTLAESRRLFAAAPDPKGIWIVPGAAHSDLHRVGGAEYERRLLAFFDEYLRQ